MVKVEEKQLLLTRTWNIDKKKCSFCPDNTLDDSWQKEKIKSMWSVHSSAGEKKIETRIEDMYTSENNSDQLGG